MKEPTHGNLEGWRNLARKERKGMGPDELVWESPGKIPLKPLNTAEDLESLAHVDSLPGMTPLVRGPRATMHAGQTGVATVSDNINKRCRR